MFSVLRRNRIKSGFLLLALVFLSTVFGFYTPIANAASNSLSLSSVSVLSKSEGVEGDITKSSDTEIEHSITFHKVGDSVDFSVKMTNNDAKKYVVESVAAENDSEYVVYEIGNYAGTIIQENGEFVFSVHEVYAKQLDDLTQRAQAAQVKFTIKFGDKVEEIVVNPKTSDAISGFMGIAVISTLGLVFAVYMIRKNKKATGIIAAIVVALLVIVPVARVAADDNYAVIELVGESNLEDRVVATLTIDGEEQEVILNYGETLLVPEVPAREGWELSSWKADNNEDYDFEQPVTGDVSIHAEWIAKKDTPYLVIHKKMNLDGESYTEFEREEKTGETGKEVEPDVKEYEGFYSPEKQKKEISGDGKMVIEYEYKRKQFKFVLADGEGQGTSLATMWFYYDTVIRLDAVDLTGYTFKRWSNGLKDAHTSFKLKKNTTVWPIYAANKYTIYFNGNRATSGQMEKQVHTYDQELALTKNAFVRDGYDFTGWNTKKGGTGTAYSDEQVVKNLLPKGSMILYAQWVARDDTPYTVIHKQMDVNGETYTTVETEHLKGTTDTKVKPATKTYAHFTAPSKKTITIKGDGSAVVEYLYKRKQYELKLKNEQNIESEFTSGKYYYDTLITLVAKDIPGYTFRRWTNKVTDKEISFNLVKKTTIGPEYLANKYTVVFDKNKATSGTMKSYKATYDKAFVLSENKFKRVGYDYVGWNTAADGSGDSYADKEEVMNLATEGTVTLYAQWKARTDTKYKVIHEKMNLDGETYKVDKVEELTGTSDEYVTPAVNLYKGFESPAAQRVKIEPDGSLVVTYQYKRMKMDLTLTNEEFIESEFKTGKYFFDTMIKLEAKERKGYKFKKWSNGDTNTVISFKLTSNTKIGPEYLPNKYNVKFDGNGATSGKMETYYTYYDEHFTLPENQFKRLGYDFTGWNTKADGSGQGYNNIQKVKNLATEGTVVLYAQWKPRKDTKYEVEHWQMNLNGKGYTLFETDKLEGETDSYVEPETKKYEGFKAPEKQRIKIEPDGSAKVVYEYERLKFTLTVKDPENVNEGLTSSKFYYGTVITLSGKKVKGYTLTHWTNGMEGEEISFELLGDLTIGPVYEANKYKVIFNKNGRGDVTGEMADQVHTYDQTLKLTKNAYKRPGYDFVGWSRTRNAIELQAKIMGDEYSVKNLSTGEDVTLYAQWMARTDTPYTVIHEQMEADGKTYKEFEREKLKGKTDTEVTPKVKTYEHFISPKAQTKEIKGDGSMVVTYQYKREQHLLTLKDEERIDSDFKSGYYYYGMQVKLTAKKVPGYTFIEWTNGTKDETISFELLNDTEIGPIYEANHYNIRFDGNGATSGTMLDLEDLVYDGDKVQLTANAYARAGYDYAGGWNTDPKGNGTAYAEGALVKNVGTSGTAILYAQWTPRDDTKYVVIHKIEKLDGTYETMAEIEGHGTTDTAVTPDVIKYDHHDLVPTQTANIDGDGSRVIVYEYPLTKIKLNLTDAQHIQTTTYAGSYKYGTTITLTAKKRFDDYYFTSWTNGSTDETISFKLTEETTIGPNYAYDSSFHTEYIKTGPCKFNGPNAPMDGDGCEEGANEKGYVDTGIALFSKSNLHKDFVVSFNISGLDAYSSNVGLGSEDYRPTFFNATLEVGPGYPGVVVRRHNGTSNLLIGSNVVKNGRKISDKKITIPMASVSKITLIRRDDNFCYSINNGEPVFVNNFKNHDAYFDQTAWFGASIENGVVYRNLKGTMTNMEIKLGEDVHERFTCNNPN